MILTYILIMIIFLYILIDKKVPKIGVLVSIIIPITILMVWLLEYYYGNIEFFISDENAYLEIGRQLNLSIIGDGYPWYLINYLLYNYDIYLNGLSLKIINIPIYMGLLIVLYKTFREKMIFILPIVLPYTAFLAINNLRDLSILLSTSLTIYMFFNKRKSVLLWFIPLVLLYLLRPFAALILIILLFLPDIYRVLKKILKGQIKINTIVFLLVITGLFLLFLEPVSDRVNQYQRWFEYTRGDGLEQHIESHSSGVSTGNRNKDFLISLIRYVVTPMPHSLVERAISGDVLRWGIIENVVRIIHQTFYFIFLGYLFLNLKYIKPVLKTMHYYQTCLIISFLSYWPIYSYHLYGATHQRLKIPFQIMIFILVLLIVKEKRKNRSVK